MGDSKEDRELERELDALTADTVPTGPDAHVATVVPPPVKTKLNPLIIVPTWIVLSGSVILFNKYIFSTLHFPYPVFLTAYHMCVAAVGTRLIRRLPGRFSQRPPPLSWNVAVRTIVPLAGLFSASLILSNVAYVHLSVSFVQMLKAFIPILVLVIQLICGLQKYNHLLLAIIVVTCLGCSIAASGELRFSVFGFICQICAVIVESARLVLIQVLLSDYKIDPLSSIEMYSPLCAIMIGCLIPIFEGAAPFRALAQLGAPVLIANGAIAFSLNLAGVFLIDSAGSLVLTLSGVLKDILLILCSVVFFGSAVTFPQFTGYSIALGGLTLFRLTGGNPDSPLGRQITGLFTPVTQSGVTGSRRLTGLGTAAVLVMVASSLSFYNGGLAPSSFGMSRFNPADQYTRHITMPLGGKVDMTNGGIHSRYSQAGAGLDVIPSFDATVDVHRLPRFAWVIVATSDAIARYGQELTHLTCYAARAGITLIIEPTIMLHDRNFMTARHRTVAKYLRYYQWVMATDADTIVLDSTRDPREFLDDAVDFIVNDRDNKEVCACGFMVKNSPGGWSMLRRWVAWADHGSRQNLDNGDLVEMVAAGVRPGLPNNADDTGRYKDAADFERLGGWSTAGCINNVTTWPAYKGEFVGCYDDVVAPIKYADETARYWETTLWAWSDSLPPVKFRSYKIMSGFFRWAAGEYSSLPSMWQDWYDVQLPGDVLGGGKALALMLDQDSMLCTGKEWRLPQKTISIDEARAMMVKHGFFWWPGCFDDNGTNVCRQEAAAAPKTVG